MLLLPCACARNVNSTYAARASASETLTVKVAAAQIPTLIQSIQRNTAFGAPGVMLNLSPLMDMRHATSVQIDAYEQALTDARSKATTIARQLGTSLGSVTSVAEIARDSYQNAAQPALRVEKSATVQAPGNGPVMLAVSYATALGPISVYGIAPSPKRNDLSQADGVMLTISVRDSSLATAEARLRSIDDTVRRIASSFNATVAVSNADLNSF